MYLSTRVAHALGISLCQRKRDHADCQQQKQVKRASNKMRFDVGVNLFFHKPGSVIGAVCFFLIEKTYGRGGRVGRCRGLGEGLGVGVAAVPTKRNSWSGPFCVRQLVLRAHVRHPAPKPPPGFCQAAPALDITNRLSQNHWPEVLKSSRACTDTQYVPSVSVTGLVSVITKSTNPMYGLATRLATNVPGSVALSL